ncbi:MAG: hypothetical protein QOF78_570 [Phycisphaerales bacterium]|jgi:prepilin-type N-terminal cleavage/methylation domain-containing protein/prepilin-type processing-associated H-X9-DG protein|nr:hypothetical protein [Phycisphaerales bacterium]MEA2734539.1 hypothetical protein [Humisphaera sp.]
MLHCALRHRRNHPFASPPVKRNAFTLAELLIVIAIIGVLISILLPTLGSARRAANSAKCLAQLRDLGLAFQQYAMENKRAFPVVEYAPPPAQLIAGSPPRRSWQDFLVKYIHKRDPTGDLKPFRNASPLWGCPAYDQDTYWRDGVPPGALSFNVPTVANMFNTGYGMQRYPLAPHSPIPPAPVGSPGVVTGTAAAPGNTALIRDPVAYGAFFKMETWGKRAAERGLIADSNSYDIVGSSSWTKGEVTATPPTARCDPFVTSAATTSYIIVDGTRHISPTANIKKILNSKGVNMLFVDGHATPVTPEEVWVATRGGGIDIRK